MPIEKILRAYIDETEEEEIVEEKIEKPESEVMEPIKEVESMDETEEVPNKVIDNAVEIVKIQPDTTIEPILAIEDSKKDLEISVPTFSTPKFEKPIITSSILNTGESLTSDIIKSPRASISFNNNDHVVKYEANDKPNIITPMSSSLVSAPKTVERLEKISHDRNVQRKLEEDEEDDEEKMKIFGDSPLSLDALDVQVLDNSLSLNNAPILTGVEVLG
jgi:hypothetical protein